jgi:hypothetical protein
MTVILNMASVLVLYGYVNVFDNIQYAH